MIQEKQMSDLLKSAKKSKKGICALKKVAFDCGNLELVAELRELEKKLFPESPQTAEAKVRAKKLNLLFRMVEIDVPLSACWVIAETLSQYNKTKGNFDMKQASKIIAKRMEIFDKE